MPYGERKEKAVTLALIPGLLYAFRTDVADGTSTALGHVDALAGGNYKQGVVFGINSPKPPKARKLFASANKRYEESFVSSGSIDTARAAGWEIRPGKIMSLRNTKFSKIVSVAFKVVDPVDAAEGVEAQAEV